MRRRRDEEEKGWGGEGMRRRRDEEEKGWGGEGVRRRRVGRRGDEEERG